MHIAVMEYMAKQNMALREEVLDLTTNHDNDVQCLDWSIERMELQIKLKKLEIDNIEPTYGLIAFTLSNLNVNSMLLVLYNVLMNT